MRDERRETRDEGRGTKSQVLIEFSFCMVVIFLMIYATMMIFRWTGSDLAGRRVAHDDLLTTDVEQRYGTIADGPLKQIDPYFYRPTKMNAVWDGN